MKDFKLTYGSFVVSILQAPLKTAKEPSSDWPEAGNVELNAYSVRYRKGQDCVLKGIDLSIRAGEKVR